MKQPAEGTPKLNGVRPIPVSTEQRVRGTTLLSAPLFVLGLIGSSFALALALWAVWNADQLNGSFWWPFVISTGIGLGAFVAASGCFLKISSTEVCDVVGWITVQRIDRSQIQRARVRLGPWRWFELEMQDGTTRTLVGASPTQLPSRLLSGADEQDMANLDLILGPQTE
ncbi:MAG: hypothetical protein WD029_03580 [Microthrixaceae bacterium]